MNRGRGLFGVCLLAAACVLVSSSAYAASGTVTGSWRLFNRLGNYCDVPSGTAGDQNGTGDQTCNTATRYPESQYQTYQPIADSKVYLKACSNTDVSSCTAVYGQSNTDANGSFSIPWSASTTPPYFRIFWQLENKDDRFRVRGSGGGTLAYWTSALTASSGTLVTGIWSVGSSTSPSDIANIYYGAHRMWYDALSYSTRMVNNFTGLEIRTNDTNPNCSTGCAFGASNLITLPSGAEYRPQARILHEMGHIASYKSNPRRLTHGQYCYPNTTGQCGWTQTSSEWRGIAQEEGFATFLGDVALYWSWHTDPRTCNSTGTCSSGSSIENGITCSGTVGRRALQVDRYMWDIYDTLSDSENVNVSYFAFFDTWGAVPNGYAWSQDESPFLDSGSTVDAWDSFHPWEWRNAMLNQYSGAIDTQTPYFNNCMAWF